MTDQDKKQNPLEVMLHPVSYKVYRDSWHSDLSLLENKGIVSSGGNYLDDINTTLRNINNNLKQEAAKLGATEVFGVKFKNLREGYVMAYGESYGPQKSN